jgi:hypothetical protein
MPTTEHTSRHSDADVPAIIEIAPRDEGSMDYDCYTDTEDVSQTDEMYDHNQQHHDDRYEVSHQDLDALKRMVREMLANPDLLLCSPVYSKVAITTKTHQITPIHDASSSAPQAPAPTTVSSSRTSLIGLNSVTSMQDIIPTYLCQECNSNVLLSPRPIEPVHPSSFIQQIPSLPFQATRLR